MRMSYRAAIRRGEKVEYEDAVVWVDELPPEYRRGQKRKMKSRKYKQSRQQPVDEGARHQQTRKPARRSDRGN